MRLPPPLCAFRRQGGVIVALAGSNQDFAACSHKAATVFAAFGGMERFMGQ